jgi:hypothetical protein
VGFRGKGFGREWIRFGFRGHSLTHSLCSLGLVQPLAHRFKRRLLLWRYHKFLQTVC